MFQVVQVVVQGDRRQGTYLPEVTSDYYKQQVPEVPRRCIYETRARL